jgi:SHAQKYF class myb-like DNA-binding protein
MAYDMMNSSSAVVSTMRPQDYDLPNTNAAVPTYSYKSAFSFPGGRAAHASLSLQEQAELEYELRYRGNMIVDQQRKIQQLEEELRQARDQVDMMNNQLSTYEQDRVKEKKKPQSRYWTPEEHQRFLEALQKYGHKDVKSISMHVSTRNATQVRTHAQKYFLRLERERRKKEETGGSGVGTPVDGYDSSGSLDDDLSLEDEMGSSHGVSISSLTLPGSPAVMMNDSMGTPPGTPGDSTPGTPGTPAAQPSSPVPIRSHRRRATSLITSPPARLAAQHKELVLDGSPTWTGEDYDLFMKALFSMPDKQDDAQTLCRVIREQYFPHHTLEEVEQFYKNFKRCFKHKPIVGSPKRRRTISRPEPLSSSLGIAAPLAPSFPASHIATFPYRNAVHSPTSNSPTHVFTSSPSHSPLVQSQAMHSPTSQVMRSSPFEYMQEFPMISDLNLNGMAPHQPPNMSTMNPMGPQINGISMGNLTPSHMQQVQQHLQQGINTNGAPYQLPNSPQNLLHNPHNASQQQPPITPNSWGTALPFPFDTLMIGTVPQTMPLATHN